MVNDSNLAFPFLGDIFRVCGLNTTPTKKPMLEDGNTILKLNVSLIKCK